MQVWRGSFRGGQLGVTRPRVQVATGTVTSKKCRSACERIEPEQGGGTFGWNLMLIGEVAGPVRQLRSFVLARQIFGIGPIARKGHPRQPAPTADGQDNDNGSQREAGRLWQQPFEQGQRDEEE